MGSEMSLQKCVGIFQAKGEMKWKQGEYSDTVERTEEAEEVERDWVTGSILCTVKYRTLCGVCTHACRRQEEREMNEWININVFTRKHSSICRWYEYYDIYMLKLPQRRFLLLLLDLELSWYEIWPLIWNASEACYTHKIIPLYTKPLNNLDVGMLNLITQLSGDS